MHLKLSPKYKAFLKHRATVEFLEGTTFAGKTTIGVLKFIDRVTASEKKFHVLSGLNAGTIERNMIHKEFGILDFCGGRAAYYTDGKGKYSGAHIALKTARGVKIIYVLGYDTKTRWKKILGGQYGCVYVDEINVADMDYIREIGIRCDYFLATLNPDDPGLPVYKEYINHARPVTEWAGNTPEEMLEQLDEPAKEGWTHWYFNFDDNAGLKAEKRARITGSVPKDTKLYKNKILGLRGRAEGLIFHLEKKHVLSAAAAKEFEFSAFSCGVDTSYSKQTDDAFAFVFSGITKCRKKIALADVRFNNRELAVPLSPSDLPEILCDFLRKCEKDWGFARDVFIDSADQATIMECAKYKQKSGVPYNFLPAYKKTKIMDRIHLQLGWMARGFYFITENCGALIEEMNAYSWKTDKNEPEDRNDHAINADQYGWIPFKEKIG